MNRCGAFLIAWALIGCGGKRSSDADHGPSAASTSGAGGAVANGGAGSASASVGGSSTLDWGGMGGGSSSSSGGTSSGSGSGGMDGLNPCGSNDEMSDAGVGGESTGGSPGIDLIVRTCTRVGPNLTVCEEFAFATQADVDDFDAKCVCAYGSPTSTCDEIGAVAECRSASTELPHHVRTVYYGFLASSAEDECTDPGQTWTLL